MGIRAGVWLVTCGTAVLLVDADTEAAARVVAADRLGPRVHPEDCTARPPTETDAAAFRWAERPAASRQDRVTMLRRTR